MKWGGTLPRDTSPQRRSLTPAELLANQISRELLPETNMPVPIKYAGAHEGRSGHGRSCWSEGGILRVNAGLDALSLAVHRIHAKHSLLSDGPCCLTTSGPDAILA